jgi:hypothetical protein
VDQRGLVIQSPAFPAAGIAGTQAHPNVHFRLFHRCIISLKSMKSVKSVQEEIINTSLAIMGVRTGDARRFIVSSFH